MARTTKKKIAEMVLDRLELFSSDKDVDVRDIYETISQSLARVLRRRYFENKNHDTAALDGGLLFTFKDREVKKDSDRNEYYVSLPSSSVDLPFGQGIRRVSDMEDRSNTYRPVPANFSEMFNGLASVKLEKGVGYYHENDNLFFVNCTSDNKPEKVMVTMYVPLEGIGDNDTMGIPQDILGEVVDICEKIWTGKANQPSDNSNDNVEQT